MWLSQSCDEMGVDRLARYEEFTLLVPDPRLFAQRGGHFVPTFEAIAAPIRRERGTGPVVGPRGW